MSRAALLAPPWPFRLLWLLLPVLAGPAIADAFADRARGVQVVAAALAWSAWAAVLVGSLIPRTVTLTLLRLVAPGAVVLAAWSGLDADRPAWAAVGVLAAALATLAALAPGTADAFVDGSSYGDERRVALRLPMAVAAAGVPIAWVVAAASAVSGPLLLAAEQWVPGAALTAIGLPVLVAVVVRLHTLSRRWLVFVPAGIVVHDPLATAEPLLLQRHLLRRIGPAPADATQRPVDEGGALDLTGGALGLALELRTAEPVSVGRRLGRRTVETTGVEALLVTPGRPATTLELAAARRLPVG